MQLVVCACVWWRTLWVMGCPAACTCTTWIETCGRRGRRAGGRYMKVVTVILVPELERRDIGTMGDESAEIES